MSETPTDRVELTEDRCGYTVTDVDGNEEPCDLPATGHRWYQDVGEHEDLLDVACDNHRNEGGRLIASLRADLQALTAERDELQFRFEGWRETAMEYEGKLDAARAELAAARHQRDEQVQNHEILIAELAAANARCAELEGKCVCLPPPATEGPQEDCPVHGRPYLEWVERGNLLQKRLNALQATLDRVTALPDEWEAAEVGVTSPDTALSGNECAAELRAALTPEGTE